MKPIEEANEKFSNNNPDWGVKVARELIEEALIDKVIADSTANAVEIVLTTIFRWLGTSVGQFEMNKLMGELLK